MSFRFVSWSTSGFVRVDRLMFRTCVKKRNADGLVG